jgi:hypothetical protein
VNVVAEVNRSVDVAPQLEVAELNHSMEAVWDPPYETVAVSKAAVWPTSYARGPDGATLTVGSALTITSTVFEL